MTSFTTFRDTIAGISLDIIYSQWAELGCNLNAQRVGKYLIDPDALLWFSLAFTGDDARLKEQVQYWMVDNSGYISVAVIKKNASDENDYRMALLDELLAEKALTHKQSHIYGDDLKYEKCAVADKIKKSPHCLLIRMASLFGSDLKKILVMALLANRYGLTGEQIADFSGYSRRMVSKVLSEWTSAGFIEKEIVLYHLANRGGWCNLLDYDKKLRLLNLWDIFEAIVTLLETADKCVAKGISADSMISRNAIDDAKTKIVKSAYLAHEKQDVSDDILDIIRNIFFE